MYGMRRIIKILATVAAFALAAPPVAAQPLPVNDPAAAALVEQLDRTSDPARQLTIVDRILAILVQPTPQRGSMLCRRFDALQKLGREAEGRLAFDSCRVLLPDDPYVLLGAAYFDMLDNRIVDAAGHYRRVAALQPGLLRQVPLSTMEGLIRQLGYQQRGDVTAQLVQALVAANYASDDPKAFSLLLGTEARERAIDGRPKDALALLPAILDPSEGVRMLIDRRSEAIWPEIERWAGPDFTRQRAAFVTAAQARFMTTNSLEALQPYAEALGSTGRRAEAIVLLKSWMTAPAKDEDERWELARAAVRLARMLADDGRRDEALSSLRTMLKKPDGDIRANANIVPNYVTHLLLSGDYKGALVALDRYTPKPSEIEAPAAAYFVALKACALAGDGRQEEAAQATREVRASYAVNAGADDIATACTGSLPDQVSLWVERADDPYRREGALLAFATAQQRADARLTFDSIPAISMQRVIRDPGALAVYLRYARHVPINYRSALTGFNESPAR